MKALFIGHSFHLKTKSSQFLLEMLAKEYEVTTSYIDPQFPITEDVLHLEAGSHFDLLVIWQIMPQVSVLRKLVCWERGVFFPMYDHFYWNDKFYDITWKDYRSFVIICFSKALCQEALKAGFDARYIQYFPKPQPVEQWGDEQGVFFWQRITRLDLNVLASVVAPLDICSVHLHKAVDPGQHSMPPEKLGARVIDFYKRVKMTESSWFPQKEDLLHTIREYALYMAPRFYEGIGMSFLDAMAMGRCVIAPDTPTMNEYVTDGVNGLLYTIDGHCDPQSVATPAPIRTLQENAYRYIQEGYARWCREKDQIMEWCRQEAQPDAEKLRQSAIRYAWEEWPLEQQPWPDAHALEQQSLTKAPAQAVAEAQTPDISVITVTYQLIENGRRDTFLQCLDSVQAQEGVRLEHVIIDGGSHDGTIDLIAGYQNANMPIRYLSMPDNGIYEAMNRGIALSRGKYVIFLNSDDYYHNPHGLHEALATLQATSCDFTFAPIIALDDTLPHSPHVSPEEFLKEIFFHAVFSHQTVLTSRQLMIDMHGFDLSFQSAADYDFVLRMLLSGRRGCYVKQSFVSYRMTGTSSVNLYLSTHETAVSLRRLLKRYAGIRLTYQEAYRMHTQGRFVAEKMPLKALRNTLVKESFVGVPVIKSPCYRLFIPEVLYAGRCLFRGRFRQLYHFFLIHFNSRFHRNWYLRLNNDVYESGQAPAAHYLETGWREGRDPSLRFSSTGYLSKYPDAAAMDICPLLHWKLIGKPEHRKL